MLELVDRMDQMPGHCMLCNSQPAEADGKPKPAVFAAGVDVNWGDAAYVCEECGVVIGKLFGMITPEKAEELETRNSFLEKQNKKLQKKLDKITAKARALIEGKKAEKELANES